MPTVVNEGVTLFYEVKGHGTALVFIHGSGSNSLSWWQQVPYLAQQYRVITYDVRCFGRSTGDPEKDFHPKFFVSDLTAILDQEKATKAILVGQSMGGWTGLGMALAAPERVMSLILVDSPGGLETKAVQESGQLLAKKFMMTPAPPSFINLAFAPDYPYREPGKALLYDQLGSLNPPMSMNVSTRIYTEPSLDLSKLPAYQTPTLVIRGEYDQIHTRAALQSVAEALPGAQFLEIAKVGHSPYWEDPASFNRIISAFISNQTIPLWWLFE